MSLITHTSSKQLTDGHCLQSTHCCWRRIRTVVATACLLYVAQYIIAFNGYTYASHDLVDSSFGTEKWYETRHAHGSLSRRVLVGTNETQTTATRSSQALSSSHKDLVPLSLADWLTFAASAIVLLLAAGGGIGGGVVMVPLFILVTGAHLVELCAAGSALQHESLQERQTWFALPCVLCITHIH